MDLAIEFARRGPWITQFVIDEVATGGDYQVTNDRRLQQFFKRFPNVPTILELGSLEGGHTFSLARHPCVERILAIEARAANIGFFTSRQALSPSLSPASRFQMATR